MLEWAEVLTAWPGIELLGPLDGGARSAVRLARLSQRPVVVHRSRRPAESLDWELHLRSQIRRHGVSAPQLVPTKDGLLRQAQYFVEEFVAGREPASARDWDLVSLALRQLHSVSPNWPQRPGWHRLREMLVHDQGGDTRLDQLPAPLVKRLRRTWGAVPDGSSVVVHGDVRPANLRIWSGRAWLLDWDEARVDVAEVDLAELPGQLSGLAPNQLSVVRRAILAWEVASSWSIEPGYARECLARLEADRASAGPESW